MADKKKGSGSKEKTPARKLDPSAAYFGPDNAVYANTPDGNPTQFKPLEDLAEEIGAEIVPGSLDQRLPRVERMRAASKASPVSGVGDAGKVTASGDLDPNDEDDDEDDEESEYAGWTKKDLIAEAKRRQLEVTRGDGEEGDPLMGDYIAALEEDDASDEDDEDDEEE